MKGEASTIASCALQVAQPYDVFELCCAGDSAQLEFVTAAVGIPAARDLIRSHCHARSSRTRTLTATTEFLATPGFGVAQLFASMFGQMIEEEIPRQRRSIASLSALFSDRIRECFLDHDTDDVVLVIEQAHHLDVTSRATLQRVVSGRLLPQLRVLLVYSSAPPAEPLRTNSAFAATIRAQAAAATQRGDQCAAQSLLERAAIAAQQDGWLLEAMQDCEQALAVPASTATHMRLLQLRAELATELGAASIDGLWKDLGRAAARHGNDSLLAYAWFHLYWCEQDGAQRDRLDRAAHSNDCSGWADRARACAAGLDGNYEDAIMHDTIALTRARDRNDWRLELMALEKLAVASACHGNVSEATIWLQESLEIAEHHHLYTTAVPGWLTLSDMYADLADAPSQLTAAKRAVAIARDSVLHDWLGVALSYEAYALANSGRLREARQLIDQALQSHARHTGSHGAFALLRQASHVFLDVGDTAGSERCLEQLDTLNATVGCESFALEIAVDRARHAALRGDLEQAAHLAEAISQDEPQVYATTALWLGRHGMVHNNVTAIATARRMCEQLEIPGPAVVTLALAESTAIEHAFQTRQVDELLEVAALWASHERWLDAARVRSCAGYLHLRWTGDTALLASSFDDLTECGATHDANHVRHTLNRSGRTRSDSHGSLFTTRESEVLQRLGTGLQTRAIASELLISPSNVQRVITALYRKTDTHSRTALARWARAHGMVVN